MNAMPMISRCMEAQWQGLGEEGRLRMDGAWNAHCSPGMIFSQPEDSHILWGIARVDDWQGYIPHGLRLISIVYPPTLDEVDAHLK